LLRDGVGQDSPRRMAVPDWQARGRRAESPVVGVRRLGGTSSVIAAALLASAQPTAAFVLGGGSADGDCRVAFGGVDATAGASGVVCADGAPCDVDGVADGACHFSVSVCTAVPVDGCMPTTIDRISVAGLPLESPPLPSHTEACGTAMTVTVPVETAMGATLLASGGGGLRDVDYLNLCCRSDTEPLAAARCALGVDPRMIAGCTTARVPALVAAEFAHARRLIERAATEPARSRRFVRRAKRVLAQMRDRGRRLAAKDDCGDSVALVASHALSTLGAQ